jgi:hypothetical protein
VRASLAASLVIAFFQAGCGKTKTLTCPTTVAQICAGSTATSGCPLTWDRAQVDTAFCEGVMPLRIDCGAYHAVTFTLVDTSRTYFYDTASGALVAIVNASVVTGSVCLAGPTSGFTVPTCEGPSDPLPQCLDGGTADGAATD